MHIQVVSTTGTGRTLLSAFDNALQQAGVYNYNLLYLSSIIPPGTDVIATSRYQSPCTEYGHRLYVVKADIRSALDGEFIGSGIGWYQVDDGRGVFVEHGVTGTSREYVEAELERLIMSSLEDLCEFRDFAYDPDEARLSTRVTQVHDMPTCALTLAVYQSEPWR